MLAQYEYNANGLRTKKTVGSTTKLYYYNGSELAYITDGSNNLTASSGNATLSDGRPLKDANPFRYVYGGGLLMWAVPLHFSALLKQIAVRTCSG